MTKQSSKRLGDLISPAEIADLDQKFPELNHRHIKVGCVFARKNHENKPGAQYIIEQYPGNANKLVVKSIYTNRLIGIIHQVFHNALTLRVWNEAKILMSGELIFDEFLFIKQMEVQS